MRFELAGLNHLPVEQRTHFEGTLAEIICESFIFTGDRDYMTARFAFFQKQSHLFLWSAAQAVEKYLKANILLLGEGAISKTHSLSGLFKALNASNPERLQVNTSMPVGWAKQGVVYWPIQSVGDFLLRLEAIGSPDVRYDQVKLEENLQDLVLLDRLNFSLRDRLVNEPVQGCRHVGKAISDCFLDFNFSFAPSDHPHPSLIGMTLTRQSVSTLEAALNGCYGNSDLYREWASKSLALPHWRIEKLLSPKG
ncbi:HEPN domain-containing protein [Hydrogenophaga sp.]|uniref:HEPN domain-containing protein n=1 Tax=Hydrogenophaga sp. TaxID=1904254 RepID=UPI0027368448|nr:HEPN domain-containing protein [Hydrogenophaga sp.]MDP3474427.1 HEPN domain-containing protein [Hydrogenophaga sp.]